MEAQQKPIPLSYQGQPWTARLLKNGMSSVELRRLIALYGLTQINNQIAANAAKEVK